MERFSTLFFLRLQGDDGLICKKFDSLAVFCHVIQLDSSNIIRLDTICYYYPARIYLEMNGNT